MEKLKKIKVFGEDWWETTIEGIHNIDALKKILDAHYRYVMEQTGSVMMRLYNEQTGEETIYHNELGIIEGEP